MLQRETRANCERYKELRRKANTICKKKRKLRMRKQLEEVNEFKDQIERRKFYKAIDNIKKGFQPRSNGSSNKNGEIIKEEGIVLQRREEYFNELLNIEKKEEEGERNENGQEATRTGRKVIGEDE
jgi:nanoRNase/pAp phosphatase (c-di-AMP/oligoRNAs hydrolase)